VEELSTAVINPPLLGLRRRTRHSRRGPRTVRRIKRTTPPCLVINKSVPRGAGGRPPDKSGPSRRTRRDTFLPWVRF
jgi:hypothetical protein